MVRCASMGHVQNELTWAGEAWHLPRPTSARGPGLTPSLQSPSWPEVLRGRASSPGGVFWVEEGSRWLCVRQAGLEGHLGALEIPYVAGSGLPVPYFCPMAVREGVPGCGARK